MEDVHVAEEISAYGNGAIWLHRTLLDSSLWKMRDEDLRLAIYLLLKANWKDAQWFNKWEHKRVTIKRGELITSLDNLVIGTGLSKMTVRTSLKHLVEDDFILLLKKPENLTQHFTHISICKYDDYQAQSFEANTRLTRHQHETNTRLTLNEEGNKNNKEKKSTYARSRASRDPRADNPAIQLIRKLSNRWPAKPVWDKIIESSATLSPIELEAKAQDWLAKGYNIHNIAWLTGENSQRKKNGVTHVSDFSKGW